MYKITLFNPVPNAMVGIFDDANNTIYIGKVKNKTIDVNYNGNQKELIIRSRKFGYIPFEFRILLASTTIRVNMFMLRDFVDYIELPENFIFTPKIKRIVYNAAICGGIENVFHSNNNWITKL